MNFSLKRWLYILLQISLICFLYQTIRYSFHKPNINYDVHYPNLLGVFCNQSSANHSINFVDNDLHIRQCSFNNIDACQQISNRSLLFRLDSTAGFTSEFNNLIRAFIYAIHTRRRFLIDDQLWNYGSFSTYFNISQGRFSPWLPSSTYCSQRKFVHFIDYQINQTSIPEHLTIHRDINGGFGELNLKMKSFEQENYNQLLQIKRLVLKYVWRTMTKETRDFIEKINMKNITFAIHVRRGDKVKQEATVIPLDYYCQGIEYFISKYQEKSPIKVFVASDQQNLIEQVRHERTDWEFVRIIQTNLFSTGHDQDSFNRLSERKKVESTRFLIAELETIAHAKYVVCTFSSNICRFVQILRKQAADTVLSLDLPWSPK